MRIYWWLCNINSKIHLWLWKVWSLVVCSQNSFSVTGARKDDKNRQNTLFCKKRCHPTNNCSLMSHFRQPNIERKNCVWTTKYKRLLEMCIVQHVETKSLFTFQPIKRLVSTTVKSAKPVATFLIFLLRNKNQQLCCLAVMEDIALQENESQLRKRKAISIFDEISPPITIKHIRTWTKKGQIESNYGRNVSLSYWLMIWATYSIFRIILFNFNLLSTN